MMRFNNAARSSAFLRSALSKLSRRSFATPSLQSHPQYQNSNNAQATTTMPAFITLYTAGFAALCTAGVLFAPDHEFDDLDVQSYCNEVLCDGNCNCDHNDAMHVSYDYR